MNEQQIRKRNFIALTLEGTFFFSGMAFLDSNSVIPVFIDTFTGSLQLAGLAATLKMASSMLAQLFMGPHVQRIKNMPAYITWLMFIFRPLPLLMIPVLFAKLNPFVTVWIFLAIFGGLWASDGLIVVPWMDVLGRTVQGSKRGKLIGYQQLLGGIGSLAAGFVIKMILENTSMSNELKYSIIFSCAGGVLLISSVCMSFAKDLPRKMTNEKVDYRSYFMKMPSYFRKNKAYAHMIYAQIASNFTGMILPFVILFSRDSFGLNPSQVSTLIYVQIIGTLIGGVFWGNISHRFGNKYVIRISQVIGFILPGIALFSLTPAVSIPAYIFTWPLALLTGINMGSWLGFMNYSIDVVADDERPIYLVLTSVITFPLTFLSYFAGLAADHFGYVPLFVVGGIAAVVTFILASQLKTPREISDLNHEASMAS